MKCKYYLIALVLIMILSCTQKSIIPISNTLEIGLGKEYLDYVELLNKAAEKDTSALRQFISIDYLYNGAGYDHGWVLLELMKIIGDKDFTKAIKSLNKKQFNILFEYIEAGLDCHTEKKQLFNQYPQTFKTLGIIKTL